MKQVKINCKHNEKSSEVHGQLIMPRYDIFALFHLLRLPPLFHLPIFRSLVSTIIIFISEIYRHLSKEIKRKRILFSWVLSFPTLQTSPTRV